MIMMESLQCLWLFGYNNISLVVWCSVVLYWVEFFPCFSHMVLLIYRALPCLFCLTMTWHLSLTLELAMNRSSLLMKKVNIHIGVVLLNSGVISIMFWYAVLNLANVLAYTLISFPWWAFMYSNSWLVFLSMQPSN